uniref:FBA_2 domain-containing protein n=1 Tax=Panagrellus redivivus TaxID=6233 RepID=A0A7E4V6G6_PANRE
MPTVELKSHLMLEVMDELLEPDLLYLLCQGEYFYVADSDESENEDDNYFHGFKNDTYRKFGIDRLIDCAMSSKTALHNFVQLLRRESTLRFRHSDVYFHLNDRSLALVSDWSEAIDAFFKFAKKVSFYEVNCELNDAAVDAFVETMERFVVFANLTDFDVRSDSMVLILKETDFPFSNLERLKITEDVDEIIGIVTTAERFPLLETVEITSESLSWLGVEISKKLVFAENPFPMIKNLNIYIGEQDNDGFTESDIKLVAGWVKKFPSLKKATITIKKEIRGSDTARYLSLHNAFKSTDFGVPSLIIHYTETGEVRYDPTDEKYKDNFVRFVHVGTFRYETFEYKDSMPGKTFKHTLELVNY